MPISYHRLQSGLEYMELTQGSSETSTEVLACSSIPVIDGPGGNPLLSDRRLRRV